MDTKIVKVLSITEKIPTQWEVLLSIGQEKHYFVFSIEKEQDEPNLLSVTESRQFSQLFQYNTYIASEILQLLFKMVNGLKVDFPQILGQFLANQQALAQQQEFNPPLTR